MRKLIALAMLAIGIWLGIKTERFLMEDRCLGAEGRVDNRGVCVGAEPL